MIRKVYTAVAAAIMAMTISHCAMAAGDDGGYNRRVLENGLVVITKEIHTAPVVYTSVWFRVGSRNETEGQTGISHALEHMLFKGTKKFPVAGDTDILVRRIGGVGNAGTSTDYTVYYESVPAGMEKVALEIEADRMLGALLREEDFATEKTVIMEERKMRNEDSPHGLFWEEMNAAAFKTHPYGRPIIGWMKDIENMNSGKIRSYYKSHYAPNNAFIVVCGDFKTEEINKTIDALFAKIPPDKTVGGSGPSPEPEQRVQKRIYYPSEKTNLAQVVYAWHVPTYGDPDSPALEVADSVLSSGRASRLYKTFVEGGLASTADATHDTNTDPYLFYVDVQLLPGVDTAEVEKKISSEIEKLKNEPATDYELRKAKNRFRAEHEMDLQSISSFGRNLGWFEITTGNPNFWDSYLEKIESVTAEDVMRVAKKYFTDGNRTEGIMVPKGGPASSAAPAQGPIKEYAYTGGTSREISKQKTDTISLDSFPPVKFASKVKEIVMPNGLTILLNENPSFPVASIHGIAGGAGSYSDPAGKEGLARLTAKMMRRETKNHKMDELNETLDFVGADISFTSGNENTTFDAESLKKDFSTVFGLLADMLLNPAFTQEGLEVERGVAISEYTAQQKDNRKRAWQAYLEAAYPGHPYSKPIGGTADGLKAISAGDLETFHKQAFNPESAIIAISGDITEAEVRALAEKHFSGWQPGGAKFVAAPVPEVVANPKSEIDMPEKMQNVFYAGFKAPRTADPDYAAFDIMTDILAGSDLTSRLYTAVREKEGLVYYIYGFDLPRSAVSSFQISSGLAPENMARAIELMRQEIRRMRDEPVPEQVLNDAKSFAVGHLPMTIETNAGIATVMADFKYQGRPFTDIDNFAGTVKAITADTIMKTARKYLDPDNFVLGVAGPLSAAKK